LVGAFAAALDRGASLRQALAEGVAAGSLACTRHGAQAALPTRPEIAALAATL
jgi:ribokinase